MKRPHPSPKRRRIVLTGGPGDGKTTAADLFRREIGDRVVIVPEAATILFQGGFPRSREPQASRFAQTAIFHVQRHLEDVQAALFPGRTLLCDRGTADGAVYWPGQPHDYFNAVGTALDTELWRLLTNLHWTHAKQCIDETSRRRLGTASQAQFENRRQVWAFCRGDSCRPEAGAGGTRRE